MLVARSAASPSAAPVDAPPPWRIYGPLLLAATVVVGIDQVTKELALDLLRGRHGYDLIEGVLSLRLTLNSGGAFGVLQGYPRLFLVGTVAIVVGILIVVRRLEDRRWIVPLGLVLGGGVGNAIDRVVRDTDGGVVDFIDLHVWPVFNVADMAIVVGAGVILLIGWRSGEPAGVPDPER